MAVPTILALGLATWLSAMLSLWRDEFATRQYAALGPAELAAATSHVDAVIAPYYAFIHLFSGFTGLGTGMRIWSVLAFAGAVAAISTLALRWWGRTAAVAAGTMLAVNGAVLSQAANARPYALALCAIAVAGVLVDAALRDRSGRPRRRVAAWIGYAVAGVFAVLMQPFAATAIVATLGLVRSRRSLIAWIIASLPWGAASLLLLANASSQGGQIEWVSPINLDTVTWAVAKAAGMTGKGFTVPMAMIALIATMALLAVIATVPRRPAAFAVLLVAMPVSLLVALSLLVQPTVSWRYLLWISLGVALLAGAAVGAAIGAPRRAARYRWSAPVLFAARYSAAALAVGLIAVTGWHTVAGLTAPPSPRDDFPATVSRIQDDARIGDLLIVQQRYGQGGVAMGFAVSAGDDTFVREIEEDSVQGPRAPLALRVVTSVDPLLTRPWPQDGDVAPTGRTLWVVGVSSPRGEDPSVLPDPIATCYRAASEGNRIPIAGTRLYRIPCG